MQMANDLFCCKRQSDAFGIDDLRISDSTAEGQTFLRGVYEILKWDQIASMLLEEILTKQYIHVYNRDHNSWVESIASGKNKNGVLSNDK